MRSGFQIASKNFDIFDSDDNVQGNMNALINIIN